jgi:hypothetical protein
MAAVLMALAEVHGSLQLSVYKFLVHTTSLPLKRQAFLFGKITFT